MLLGGAIAPGADLIGAVQHVHQREAYADEK